MADERRLVRTPFKTSRLLDFVGRRELAARIGHQDAEWPLVIVKELTTMPATLARSPTWPRARSAWSRRQHRLALSNDTSIPA